MAIKVISFDIDGTIIDFKYNIAFWDEAIPHLYAKRHGISLEAAKKIVLEENDKVGQKDIRWYKPSFWFEKFDLGDHKTILNDLKHHVNIYSDTVPALKSLHKKFKLIVVTANTNEFVDIKLEVENMGSFFDKKFSVIDDFNGIKTPDVFKTVAETLHVLPEEIVHVGDDPQFDYVMPRELGINAFLIDRPDAYELFKKPEYRKNVDESHIIKDLRELVRKVDEMGT
ncbi:MAG: HAD family hydrolase [Candidatus Aenigmarchaeota archaeon]|nr:HAD family hydrolase [Candidatus Aenigmarchaeota archaeon]